MRVLIVSEGKHEHSGALRTLVARLAATKMRYDQDRVSRKDIHAHHGKGKGYFKRAVRWMLEAKKRGCDALILVIDEDRQAERTEQISEAQQYERVPLRRALGVAIRTFDAWMLADEKALTRVLGRKVPRQPEPETIADPKSVCQTLLVRGGETMRQREMYAALASEAAIEVLEIRCPRGFAPFAQRVRAL